MPTRLAKHTYNNQPVAGRDIPIVSLEQFQDTVIRGVGLGCRLAALFGQPGREGGVRLTAVLARDQESSLFLLSTRVEETYPSLTPACPQAHLFERELAEQWNLHPQGHPWLKPVRFSKTGKPGVITAFAMAGEDVHEVAVGPVHAGVIEPGHFRFQCRGEQVHHLEISLGYQHRGVEAALLAKPAKRRLPYLETLAGDTTIGHTLAYCQAMEALAGIADPPRSQAVRAIALELERIANHSGDLGALANDVGYLPTASFCGRLRGDFLNMTALLCGNRFGRNLVLPGGVAWDMEPSRIRELQARLTRTFRDLAQAIALLWKTPSVMARFEETGRVSRRACEDLGLVGPAGRACGLERDVRFDHPAGCYTWAQIPVASWHTGDVFARSQVRWMEIQRSAAFIQEQLQNLPHGPLQTAAVSKLMPDQWVVSLVEGWRGEICHIGQTDSQGQLAYYKIVDPSFHNWAGLAMALRDQPISDFPLCNKSFNLSYCGHDL